MAVVFREFAVDFSEGKLSANPNFMVAFALPALTSGDTLRLGVTLVKSNSAAGAGVLTTMSPTGLELKVALGTFAGATATVATSVTLAATATRFEGVLPLNVAGVAAILTAAASNSAGAYIELQLTEDSGVSSLRFPITLNQEIIGSTLADTPLPDVAIGRQEAAALFVRQVNADSANPFGMIINDSDGSGRLYRFYVQDGVLRIDPIGA